MDRQREGFGVDQRVLEIDREHRGIGAPLRDGPLLVRGVSRPRIPGVEGEAVDLVRIQTAERHCQESGRGACV